MMNDDSDLIDIDNIIDIDNEDLRKLDNKLRTIDRTGYYLEKIGKLECADREYHIRVQVESGKTVTIPLNGRMGRWNALMFIWRNGLLKDSPVSYYFTDWPDVNPDIYPGYLGVGAYVCELDENKIYHLKYDPKNDMWAAMYGCPTPKSIGYGTALEQAEIVVVDYGKENISDEKR